MVEELRLRTIQRNDERVLWGRWQPSHVDNLLVEIMAPANEFIARFVYWNNHNFSIRVIKFATVLGELQVDGQYASNQTVLDQVKSEKPQPEPKSPSPATSSPKTAESGEPQSPAENPAAKSSPPPKEDFESYYMRRVTAEFADDIDKLRNAPDFSEQSVPVLIHALRQGANAFSEEEKETVMRGR